MSQSVAERIGAPWERNDYNTIFAEGSAPLFLSAKDKHVTHEQQRDAADYAVAAVNACAEAGLSAELLTGSPLGEIIQAVRDYHYALDTRQHGGVAKSETEALRTMVERLVRLLRTMERDAVDDAEHEAALRDADALLAKVRPATQPHAFKAPTASAGGAR